MQCALLSKESKLKCFTDNFLTAYKKEIEKGFFSVYQNLHFDAFLI